MAVMHLKYLPIILLAVGIGACSSEEGVLPTLPECTSDVPQGMPGCTGVTPDMNHCVPRAGQPVEDPTILGARQPEWKLQDLQPQSCGYEQVYGLEQLRGTPTMIVLLRATCGFCQAQAEKLQELKFEIEAMDVDVHFTIMSEQAFTGGGAPPVSKFTERCNFPIFQDTAEVNAWGMQDGAKDNFYFYDEEGILRNFISARGDLDINMSTTEGYNNIKNAVLFLAGVEVPMPEPEPDPEADPEADPEGM